MDKKIEIKEKVLMIFAEMFIEDNKCVTLGDRADAMANAYNKIEPLIQQAKKEKQEEIIRIIKGRLLIKKIREPIIRLIKQKE